MNAGYITLDEKADLTERIEWAFQQTYGDPGTGRLGEEVTLRQSQRGRLKNCTSSFETGHRKGKETPWGGGGGGLMNFITV